MGRKSFDRDMLGRAWTFETLDRLLGEPAVLRKVEAAARSGMTIDRRTWSPTAVMRWARDQYSREEPAALLLLLVHRFFAIGLDPFDGGSTAE